MSRKMKIVVACLSVSVLLLVSGCGPGGWKTGLFSPKAPAWKLGMQSYTFNKLTLFEAIDKAKAAGFESIEPASWAKISPDHGTMTLETACPETQKALKEKLNQTGIQMTSGYFRLMHRDEPALRKMFAIVKEMGFETMVTEPDADQIELIDKLANEYGVNVAIHNHWKRAEKPGYTYWNPDEVLKLVKGCSQRIGACPDTGHWARSGVDTVQALKKLQGRIITLHLKDVNTQAADARDVPLGKGVANIKGVLAELNRQGFKGVFTIEYEHRGEGLMAELEECVKYFDSVRRELGR